MTKPEPVKREATQGQPLEPQGGRPMPAKEPESRPDGGRPMPADEPADTN